MKKGTYTYAILSVAISFLSLLIIYYFKDNLILAFFLLGIVALFLVLLIIKSETEGTDKNEADTTIATRKPPEIDSNIPMNDADLKDELITEEDYTNKSEIKARPIEIAMLVIALISMICVLIQVIPQVIDWITYTTP